MTSWHDALREGSWRQVPPEQALMHEVLTAHGYRRACVGKFKHGSGHLTQRVADKLLTQDMRAELIPAVAYYRRRGAGEPPVDRALVDSLASAGIVFPVRDSCSTAVTAPCVEECAPGAEMYWVMVT